MSEMSRFGNKPKNKRTNNETNSMNSDITTNWVYPEIYMELVLDIVAILHRWKYFFSFQMLGKTKIQNGESGACTTYFQPRWMCLF